MAIKIAEREYRGLEQVVGKIMDADKNKEVGRAAAIGAIIHLIAAGAIDNHDTLRSWALEGDTFEDWKNGVRNA